MFLTYFLLIAGFAFLIKGADWLVDGSASIARKFNIPAIVIGLTVVAFGTSAPELVVNILASARGTTDLAIGNILGSNISNTFLILGTAAIIFPLLLKKNTVYREIPITLFAIITLAILVNDQIFDSNAVSMLSRIDGLILIVFFAAFLYYTYGLSKKGETPQGAIAEYSTKFSLLMIIGGLFGLTLGGKWIVDSAVEISKNFGVSQAFVGLTVVAIGTSLPELATSAVAAYKKRSDIAIGNIVGSNIFNIFWVLGLSALIRPIPFNTKLNFDIGMVGISTILLLVFIFIGKKHVLQKREGIAFLLIYIAYIIFLVYRG